MILYFDTSALIKRYVEEDGSREVDRLWEEGSEIITSTVAFAEIMAAFNRKYREGVIPRAGYLKLISEFKKEYSKLVLVSISPDLNQLVEKILYKHPLRGFDAIHLASALLIRNEGALAVKFICFDRQLNKAAAEEGLAVPF